MQCDPRELYSDLVVLLPFHGRSVHIWCRWWPYPLTHILILWSGSFDGKKNCSRAVLCRSIDLWPPARVPSRCGQRIPQRPGLHKPKSIVSYNSRVLIRKDGFFRFTRVAYVPPWGLHGPCWVCTRRGEKNVWCMHCHPG